MENKGYKKMEDLRSLGAQPGLRGYLRAYVITNFTDDSRAEI